MSLAQQRSLQAARSVASIGTLGWLLLCLMAAFAIDTHTAAADRVYDPDVVKAGLVAQLTRFVEWPESASGPRPATIDIVFLGESPIASALVRMHMPGLRIREVRRIPDIGQAHVIFVTRPFDGSLAATLAFVDARPILVIADTPQAAQRGATFGFRDDGTRIRIDVNRVALDRSRLRVSYHVLRLATVVSP